MILCNFPRGGPKHEKSPTVELWLAPRMSVFIGLKKNTIWATFNYIYNIS